ncbi:cofactor-independent phosphoglycerate mutase [Anaerohalosphaera lusitana]|uniref:Cofactor-independent phosphoglycerate mutase n=1 Tax=Anaerohalosphaera lusitana TaxID=1936003 RepID=A0A1U9NN16_9BACT|nr:cofactor-independent phosphoglycerate mutase [Anaerohalosphaera lusitana]AQT69299.1 cofactor-independent phosphoglycerate mutase [Anaerohalosphaera lusitana]
MKTKYAIIIPDGAADYPIEEFDGKTPLQAAQTPNMDRIAIQGRQGTVQTIPAGMPAGSDVAQMSLLGYDPLKYYNGRAPIEAAAQDIKLGEDDWAFRCNLVTIADDVMADHSAGHISTDEAAKVIADIKTLFAEDARLKFYTGVSYRHLCIITGEDFEKIVTTPPHDIIGEKASKYYPKGKHAKMLVEAMKRSQDFLADHDINRVRKDLGENPVTSIWLWGHGQRMALDSFKKRFKLSGAAITGVDLIRGLAKLIGFDILHVEGATGYIDTNYYGKGQAAVEALENYDLLFVHVEAPDEAGHSGNAQAKKYSIEQIDRHIVGPVHEALEKYQDYRIIVLPDHPTPIEIQSHTDEPVPFAMAGTNVKASLKKPFSEENAFETGLHIPRGSELMEYFLTI